MAEFLDLVLHIDKHLQALIVQYGPMAHALLFLVIFLETGLVVMPFLPGDSLLFAAGLFANEGQGFNIWIILLGLPFAAIIGDSVNFHLGKYVGGWMIKKGWIKAEWIEKTREFYAKHGRKTIIVGRFVPIVRTVAPFVAGMEIYPYKKYLPACVLGSFIWVWICSGAGFLLGTIPWVRQNFEIVILALVALSLVGIVVEVLKERSRSKRHKAVDENQA